MTEKRYTPLLVATIIAIPALAAANVYVQMNVPIEPPFFPRTVHPASPPEITVHDKKIAIETGDSPFRQLKTSNPEEFRKHVENGRRVYYQNCVFCHGDNMGGNGMFVHGLDPIPTNFADGDTIANLRETFLFWRAAKGGPGLPEEGGPWDSAMPAWEKILKEDEIWDAVLFLYEFTGERPSRQGDPPMISRRCTSFAFRPSPSGLRRTGRATGGKSLACAAVLFVSVCAWTMQTARSVRAQAPEVGTEAQRESGKNLYGKYCSQCHGDKGDGVGYATPHLYPSPATSRLASSRSGRLPTERSRRIRTCVNIIRRGMPYTSMPAWPDLSDQEVSDLAYFITTFSPDFANAENVPKPMEFPSAPAATKRDHRARKKTLRGERLPEVPRQPRTRRRTFGVDARGRLRQSDTRGGPFPTMDLPGRVVARGHLQDDDDGPERHADAVVRRRLAARAAMGDHGLHRLSVQRRRARLYQPRRRQVTVPDPIDLSKGAASFASAPCARFPIIGQIMEPGRQFHPPATSVMVQAIYDAESIAVLVRWNDMRADRTGKNEPSLPVSLADEEEPAKGGASSTGSVFGDQEVAQPPAAADPFAEPAAPVAPPSEFSDAVAIQIPTRSRRAPASPTSSSATLRTPSISGSSILARTDPLQFTGRGSADLAPNDTGDLTGVAGYDQGEWSVIFKRPLRASSGAALTTGGFLPIAFSVWDGFSRERGNRRGLTAWYSIYVEPEVVPSPLGPMARTALLILVLELIVIGWVRWSHGSRARGELGGEPSHPAATSV